MASSSILCYDCSTTSQEYCEKQQIVQTCNVGEVCRQVVHRLAPIFGGGVIAFQRGCFRNSICTESDECKGAFGGDCISCCNRNFCNNGAIDNLTTETLVPTTDGGFWHRTASPSAHNWWWHTTAAYPHDFWWWYTTSPPRKNDKSATPIIVGVTVSVISAILVFVIVLIVIIWVRRRRGTTTTTTTASAQVSAGQPAQAQSAIFVPSAYLNVTHPSLHFNSYEKLGPPPSYETVIGYRGDSQSVNFGRMSQQYVA
ncbi:uncharacterized protein LOC134188060 [Corticium candelabrum]|uniref:uncharacterized protein LOC134188060 n=1 Tax=Corticium candelabrum TaxID=121492 RepID=UPI002E259106|nr:uncharacterized protein LOC134188060 [Corticium candelabrum]